MLFSFNSSHQYSMWNFSMQSLIRLPIISSTGVTFVTDGFQLCGFQGNNKPLGPCSVQYPVTGPLFDLTVVSERYIYLLYKCGFMVGYFIAGRWVELVCEAHCTHKYTMEPLRKDPLRKGQPLLNDTL